MNLPLLPIPIRSLLVALAGIALCVTPISTAAEYSWQQPHAKVSEKGDLAWAPQPFKFEKGASVRYIDFEKGQDENDGTSKDAAWKHHPWDPKAGGKAKACKGVHTYVFKRGVLYRGELVNAESGKPGDPIRLTSDPSWGKGEAALVGSEAIRGWKQGAQHKSIPDVAKVWFADLNFIPRNVWVVEGDSAKRMNLARIPNWKVSNPEDVMSEWWEWQQPQWWTGKNKIKVGRREVHLGVDKKNLTKGADFYEGATVRSEWGIVMGTPYPSKVEKFDATRKGIAFQGVWFGTSGKIITGNRYYLEDKPHYLDAPGEFWFERKGKGGRLYLRLPGDKDPNTARVEVGKRYNLIQDQASTQAPNRMDIFPAAKKETMNVTGVRHVVISGLTFGFTNTWWDLPFPAWMHKNVQNACIKLRGDCDDVVVANCRFNHVARAVLMSPITKRCNVGTVTIRDNDVAHTDHGAIMLSRGGSRFEKAVILRNNFLMVGMRPHRQAHGHNVSVTFVVEQEIAGNIMKRCYGSGIFVFGGKGGGAGESPLSRVLIHHNKVEDSLLATNDWGGIETWQGGPFYVYNNISGNPGGYWHWSARRGGKSQRLGFAYYADGGFKNYFFNNIAWGKSNEPTNPLCAAVAFYEAAPTTQNTFFNNTIYRFKVGSNWSPRGGYHKWIGNVYDDMSGWVFAHGKLKEDKGTVKKEHPHETNAFAANVFHKTTREFGYFEHNVRKHESLESFRKALVERKAMATDLGVQAQAPVLADPGAFDFRPTSGSSAVDRGAKVFVPWSLYGTVGEWHFQPTGNDPTGVLDEHWYMTEYDLDRHSYFSKHPRFPLKVSGATVEDYEEGALETWCRGSLKLDGKSRYARAAHAEMTKPLAVKKPVGRGKNRKIIDKTFEGEALKTPDIHRSNFLVEAYIKIESGGGVIVRKMAGNGYELSAGKTGEAIFKVKSGKGAHEAKGKARINDGKWHHILAEADRKTKKLTLYVDGKKDAEAAGPGADETLANTGDLLVGGTPDGGCLTGAIDFLRIARGTLKDSRTNIRELHAWQFDGPFLRDFTGQKPNGKCRDAGALESQ